MTAAQRAARRSSRRMRELHFALMVIAVFGVAYWLSLSGETPEDPTLLRNRKWKEFGNAVREATMWAEILIIGKIFRQVTGKRMVHSQDDPSPMWPPTIQGDLSRFRFLKDNDHINEQIDTDAVLDRVQDALKSESKYLRDKAPKLSPKPGDTKEAIQQSKVKTRKASRARIEGLNRNLIHGVRSDAFWRTIQIPEVLNNVAFVEYFSAHVPASRPTHIAMSGFIAQPTAEIWKTVRPLCGWGCLCWCSPVTFAQAESRRLMKDGKPAFVEKWPNSASKRNYYAGDFPDEGWKGPKETV